MKRVEIKLTGGAAEEWERLNKVVAGERDKGVQNSENQQVFKSIKQKNGAHKSKSAVRGIGTKEASAKKVRRR